MDIEFAKPASRYVSVCLAVLRTSRADLDAGRAVEIHLDEPQGDAAAATITIRPEDRSTFDADWPGTDAAAFPERLRSAATALREAECTGTFRIEHANGVLKVQRAAGA